jgi:arylsulfatase A-like enzyme
LNADLVDFSDFFPTLAEAAQIPVPEDHILDGQSFLGQILGKAAKPKEYIYMYYEPKWGNFGKGIFVRNQKYKLYSDGRFYNIEKDVLEENPINLATSQGEDLQAGKKLTKSLARMTTLAK